MTPLVRWLRMLGNAGAVANARALTDERGVEEWAVAVLASRIDAGTGGPPPVSDRPASAA